MSARFILVHSPLCGPLTWAPVAEELRRRGLAAAVPTLRDTGEAATPYWRRHATSIAAALDTVPTDLPLVLIGHSGAGPLLPAIRRELEHAIGAYLFADAGLPHPGRSRLDEIALNAPDLAEPLRADLLAGGRYPTWRDDDLRALILDDRLRAGVVAELQPRALDFFSEPLPANLGWPEAPCGYLRFSAAYDTQADEARALGWPVRTFDAGHFHQLVDPAGVAETLIAQAWQLL